MSNKKKLLWIIGLTLSLLLVSTACKKKSAQTTPTQEPPAVTTPEPAVKAEPEKEVNEGFQAPEPERKPVDTAAEINARGQLKTVYFEFDKSDLSETARATLRANSDWLKANAQWNVVIEGHCDERGTIEYNLARGQRRASSVREYMASLGVATARIRVVSYGEERPVDPGHNEAAWAKNRRAESKVEAR